MNVPALVWNIPEKTPSVMVKLPVIALVLPMKLLNVNVYGAVEETGAVTVQKPPL